MSNVRFNDNVEQSNFHYRDYQERANKYFLDTSYEELKEKNDMGHVYLWESMLCRKARIECKVNEISRFANEKRKM